MSKKILFMSSAKLTAISIGLLLAVFCTIGMSFRPVYDEDEAAEIVMSGPRRSHWTTSTTSCGSTTYTYHNKNDYGKAVATVVGGAGGTVSLSGSTTGAQKSLTGNGTTTATLIWSTNVKSADDSDQTGVNEVYVTAHTNTVTFTATLTKGYRFLGWYSDSGCTQLVSDQLEFEKDVVIPGGKHDKDITSESTWKSTYGDFSTSAKAYTETYYAKYELIPTVNVTFLALPSAAYGNYVITFDETNTTVTTANVSKSLNDQVVLTANPNAAYAFDYWYTEDGEGNKSVLSSENPLTTSFSTATKNVGAQMHLKPTHLNMTFKAVEVDINGDPVGSYTVNSTTVSTSDYVYNTGSAYSFSPTLTATPAEGYAFSGWYTKEGKKKTYLSTSSTWTPTFEEEIELYAGFAFNNYSDDQKAQFKVGSTYYTDLNAANTAAKNGSNKTIVCTRDGVLPPGNYTISSGVSLLIPYSTSESLQTKPVKVNTTASATAISAYRKLTFTEGAYVVCDGNIYVGGQADAGNGGSPSGYVTGPCGMIDMSAGGHIDLNGKLYCWGFIKGQDWDQGNNTLDVGTITANSGAEIWEDFAVGDWRGGTATTNFGDRFFPFQSYFIQNVEVPVTYKYGSSLKNFFTFNMSSSAQETSFTLIGSGTALFKLKDSKSTVRKWYDPTTDLMCYELSGSAVLDQISLTISIVTINSSDYDLPINSNMHLILTNCDLTLNSPLLIQPGGIVEVKEDARVTLSTKIYLYDKDEWGPWISGKYYRSYGGAYPIPTLFKKRGDGATNDGIDDAKIIVDGTLTISNGYGLFSSAGGADVMGNGGGKIVFPSALLGATSVKWYKGTKTSGDGELGTTAMNVANLCNDDASYTKAIKSTTFHNVNGRWFAASAKDEKDNHTYDFTYISSGAVSGTGGTSSTTDAVYSWDKTGLELRQKWANVTYSCEGKDENENTHYWWQGQGEQSSWFYNWTINSDWHQFMPTATEGMYSGSNNKIYTKTDCDWEELGETDENCLYTIGGVKKALVDGEFIALEPNNNDPAYHAADDATKYYICFSGCNWHEATKYENAEKAYVVDEDIFIWYDGAWMNAEWRDPFFYTLDETDVPIYYEYLNGEWVLSDPYIRVTDGLENRTYWFLNEAFAFASGSLRTSPTIKILRDISGISTAVSYTKANGTCTLDLNGHTITGDVSNMITVNAAGCTFTITDNSANENGKINLVFSANNSRRRALYVQNGHVILEKGTIASTNTLAYSTTNTKPYAEGVLVANGKQFTMNGGRIEVSSEYNPYGIEGASGTPTITINGGTLETIAETKDSPYAVFGYGTINITGGTINAIAKASSSAMGVYVYGSASYQGTANISGGTILARSTSSAQGARCWGSATVTADYNAETPDNTPKARYYANLIITGGTITAECTTSTTSYGVLSYGTTHISGGTITSTVQKSNQNTAYGVAAIGGTTTISAGANIIANAPTKAYGVTVTGANGDSNRGWPHVGVVNITGGTITANTTNTTTAYGLLVTGATWTINKANGYSVFNGDYAAAGTAVVTGGNFYANAKTTIARGIAVAATQTKNAASATPKCTINGGYYKMTGTGDVLGCNASALPADFQINGGYYSHDGNLATYVPSPKHVLTLASGDANRPPYYYKVAEAYLVTFKNEDGTANIIDPVYQEVGTTPVCNTEPTKESTSTNSFTFDGWATEANGAKVYEPNGLPNVTSAGATYYAHFATTTLKYRVHFDAATNGGECATENIYVNPGTAVGSLPTATKYGYTFNGWFTAATGGTQLATTTVINADADYYAQFTANSHTLTWDLAGGTVSTAGKIGSTTWPAKNATGTQSRSVAYGTVLTTIPVVTKTGYTFNRWDPVPTSSMPDEDMTYTALWNPNINTAYTVKHYLQNVDGTYPAEPTETEALTGTTGGSVTPSVKSYEGFTSPATQTVTIAAAGTTVVEYRYARRQYTFTLDAYTNGGTSEVPSIEVIHGATIGAVPPDAQKGCNDFTGWYTKPVGGVKITPEFVIEYDMKTLYAQFSDDVRTYPITYNAGANGTGAVAAGTKTCGEDATLSSSTFTRDGYAQTGWSLTDGGAQAYDLGGTYMANAALTLYPVWTLVGYQINFVDEDGTTTLGDYPKTLNPGATVTAPTEPTKAQTAEYTYTFAGWSDGTNTYTSDAIPNVTAAVTYTATYTATPNVASVTVGGATTYYTTLPLAFAYAADKTEPTITILRNITLSAKVTYTNSSKTTVTIDLNGKTISGGANQLMTLSSGSSTGGQIIIKSSVDGGQIRNVLSSTSARSCVYLYKGKLKLESGTIYNENTNTGGSNAVLVAGSKTFTMTGGTLQAQAKKNGFGLYNYGTSTISGGSIIVNETSGGTASSVYAAAGTTTLKGTLECHITGTSGVYGAFVGGATPASDKGTLYNGTLIIEGGTFNATANSSGTAYGAYCTGNTRAINYSTSATYAGNYADAGTLQIKGGVFTVEGKTTYGVGMKDVVSISTAEDAEGNATYTAASATPKATVSGGKFNLKGTTTKAAVTTTATNANQLVEGGWYNVVTNLSGYVAPTKDCNYYVLDLPSSELPYKYEVAEAYNITFKNGETTMQEGPVKKGTTPTYNGATPTKDADADGVYTFNTWTPAISAVTGNTTYTATYSTEPTVASVTINGTITYYANIDAAFTAANASATYEPTITLLRDASTATTTFISYTGARNCTLNLNGHTLSSTTAQALLYINMEGITFTITDLTESKLGTLHLESTSTSDRWCVYVAKGNLQMDAGTISLHSKANQFNEAVRIDPAASTFTMNGGKVHVVTSDGKPACGIVSKGVTVINGGAVQVEASGIGYGIEARVKDTNIGNITVKGGKFLVTGTTAACAYKSAANATLKLQGGYYNTNTNLEANCATPYHVLPLTGEDPYEYEVAEAYNITFRDGDNNTIQEGPVKKDVTPVYTGETPTKTEDANYTYTFNNSWEPAIVPATAAATYTAQFDAVAKARTYYFIDPATGEMASTTSSSTPADPADYSDEDYIYGFVDWTDNGDGTSTANYSKSERFYGDFLDVVDWTDDYLSVNTSTLSLPTDKAGWTIKKGSDEYTKSNRQTDRTVRITRDGTHGADDYIVLKLSGPTEGAVSRRPYTVPHIYSADATLTGTLETSIVYVNSGTLTISGSTTLAALYVAPEASVKITSGTLTVGKLVLRTLPWQSASISGDVDATEAYYTRIGPNRSSLTGLSGTYTYKSANYYPFALPISCRVEDVSLSDGSSLTYGGMWQLKTYNEVSRAQNGADGENWDVVSVDAETLIEGGKGYLLYSNSNYYREFYFPVDLNEATTSVAVSYTTEKTQGATHEGWNMIASPLLENHTANPKPENPTVSQLDENNDYQQSMPEIIKPTVPFFYQVSSSSPISFGGSTAPSLAPRRRVAAADEEVRIQWIHLDVKDANGQGDETSVYSHPTRYEEAYKTGIDVAKQSLTATRARLYSSHAYGDMAFAGVSDELFEQGVALTVYSPAAQELTFSLRQNEWLNRLQYVWIIDFETGAMIDLLSSDYTAEVTEGTTYGRFYISGRFRTPQIATDIESTSDSSLKGRAQKVLIEEKIYIMVGDKLYDATGKLVKGK